MAIDRDDLDQTLLRSIVEGSDDAIVSMTLDGIVTSWNPSAERMFGYPAAEMIGEPVARIVPPDRLSEESDVLRCLSCGERIALYETERRHRSGAIVDVSVTVSPLRDADGRIAGAAEIARDVTQQKRRERLERADAEWRRATLASIGDAVIATDAEGRVAYMNPVAEDLTGWTSEAAMGRPLHDVFRVVDEHTRQPVEDPAQRAVREGKAVELAEPALLVSRDGQERSIDDSAAPILDERGGTMGVVLVFRPAGERRGAEALLLREREARFRVMADSAPVMIWMAGTNTECEFFNAPWLEFTGRRMEDELGAGWAEGVHPEDFQHCFDTYLAAFNERRPFRMEYRLRRRDGQYRWLLDTGIPRFEADGRFAGFIGSCVDITERRQAEADMAQQREWLRVTLGSIGDAVIATDLDARVTFMNPVAESVTGWPQAEAEGRPLADVFDVVEEDTREAIDSPVSRVLREGVIAGRTHRTLLRRRDGSAIPIDDRAAPIRDRNGAMVGAVLVFHDVVERRRAEAERAALLVAEQAARMEAERANRAKDDFLAMVSHELRTPLNVVYGWARMLRTGNVDADTSARALETIERNSRLQVQHIEDLLDVSRITSGKLRLAVQRVDLAAVIDGAMELVQSAAADKAIEIGVSVDPEARAFAGDPDRLQQVVWNLLSNAVHFTPAGGRIDVGLARTAATLELTVTDTGPGIAPELLPHVFERFRQGRRETATPGSGLGLGLAIVRELVQLHRGTVEARSGGEGTGATFVVTLPSDAWESDVSADLAARVEPAFPSLAGIRVLLVEDDPDGRPLMADILRRCGAEVAEAADAREAIDLIGRGRFDALVSDIGLPGQDGYAMLRAIRRLPAEENGRIPALAVTALAREEDRRRAIGVGYRFHLAKPVEPVRLALRVAELVGRTGDASGPA